MKVGDLVKLRWCGNGRPRIGMIISVSEHNGAHVLWDNRAWPVEGYWSLVDLVVLSESR